MSLSQLKRPNGGGAGEDDSFGIPQRMAKPNSSSTLANTKAERDEAAREAARAQLREEALRKNDDCCVCGC